MENEELVFLRSEYADLKQEYDSCDWIYAASRDRLLKKLQILAKKIDGLEQQLRAI